MKNNEYTPISCAFYDILEALATKANRVLIVYLEEQVLKEVVGVISTFQIKNKVEFLVLASNQKIRLDALIEIDGNKRSDYNYC